MASTATATASCRAGVTEEAKAEWWLRFNNGVPAYDDGDVADSGDEVEGEGEGDDGAEGKAEMAPSGGRAPASAVAGDEEAEMMGSGDGRAAAMAVASGVRAEMVGRGGGKAEAGAGGMRRRSSPRFADRAGLDEEISGGNYVLPGELPRRKKAIAKRRKPNVDGVDQLQNDMSQAQSPCAVLKGPEQVCDETENLRLQLALKTNELKEEENRRIKLELILKAKENESLRKQNEELRTENEQLRKNAKPERVKRLCRFCNTYDFHDYRNCPERRKAAGSPEEEDSY